MSLERRLQPSNPSQRRPPVRPGERPRPAAYASGYQANRRARRKPPYLIIAGVILLGALLWGGAQATVLSTGHFKASVSELGEDGLTCPAIIITSDHSFPGAKGQSGRFQGIVKPKGGEFDIELPGGNYAVTWVNVHAPALLNNPYRGSCNSLGIPSLLSFGGSTSGALKMSGGKTLGVKDLTDVVLAI